MIFNINPGGGGKPKLLWTNPNPSAAFGAQTVSVSLSNYTGVIIKFRDTDAVSRYIYVPKVTITSDNCPAVVNPGGTFWRPSSASVRLVTAISDTGITFSSGRFVNSSYDNDNVLQPLQIYGVKWEI